MSFCVTGGDEWMRVAEALDLKPAEIRFLDKRFVNPMDAALTYATQQCPITVGDLYDLLTRCEVPVIADLL